MKLYPEMAKNANAERAVLFGTENRGVPGEEHAWRETVAARGPTQARSHLDPSYDPTKVDDPNQAGLGGTRRHGGMRGGVRGFITAARTPYVVEDTPCPEGEALYRDRDGTLSCRPVGIIRPLEGLGSYPLSVESVQRTVMQRRDFVPTVRSSLNPVAQHFERGQVAPERRTTGTMPVVSEDAVRHKAGHVAGGRLRAETRDAKNEAAEVNGLGELEPRMGVWGHEQSNRMPEWFSPPGPRRIAKNTIDPTQDERRLSGLGDMFLAGIGDIEGSRSKRLLQFATAQNQAIQQAAAQGDVNKAVAAAAITPWQPVATQQQVAAKLATPLGYQDIAAKIQNALNPTAPVKLPTSVPVPLPTGQAAQNLAPSVPNTPINLAPAPPSVTNVIAPNPAPAPAPATPGLLTGNALPAPGPVPTSIPLPGAPPPPAGLVDTSGGGGGGGGDSSSLLAPDASAAPPAAPAGPFSFLTNPITLPLIGQVPTGLALGGVAAVIFLVKRKRAARSETRTNPKKGKKAKSRKKAKR